MRGGRGKPRKIRRERSRRGGSQNGKISEGHINRRIINKEEVVDKFNCFLFFFFG